jgi:hypothetical protein
VLAVALHQRVVNRKPASPGEQVGLLEQISEKGFALERRRIAEAELTKSTPEAVSLNNTTA